jgi:hypothetical protein
MILKLKAMKTLVLKVRQMDKKKNYGSKGKVGQYETVTIGAIDILSMVVKPMFYHSK